MNIKVKLRALKGRSLPSCRILFNDHILYESTIIGERDIILDVPASDILDNNILTIEHFNKQNSDTIVDDNGNIIADTAIELSGLVIEELNVPITTLHNYPFYPYWPDNIIEEFVNNNQEIPKKIENNLYFGFNGKWLIDINKDYRINYFQLLWNEESNAHKNYSKFKEINGEKVAVFEKLGTELSIAHSTNITIHELAKIIGNDPDFK